MDILVYTQVVLCPGYIQYIDIKWTGNGLEMDWNWTGAGVELTTATSRRTEPQQVLAGEGLEE